MRPKGEPPDNRNVVFLGLVSFFTDLSTKMVYPLLPLYLTAVFGVTPLLIGVIEGFVDSLAELLKVFSGRLSDGAKKKKPLAFSGYATGVIYKVILIFAGSWVGIFLAKAIDRLGKGIRTTPRDMLIADSSEKKTLGKSFGLQKMLDKAGSALGILIAYFLLVSGVESFRTVFLISIIPAVLGLCMFFFIKERTSGKLQKAKERPPFFASLKLMDGRLKLYLLVVFIFTLGSSSDVFILLRAQSLGFSDSSVILLFFVLTLFASIVAIPIGKFSDRLGRKAFLAIGYLLFSVTYLGLAAGSSDALVIGMFLLYGAHIAMISVAQRAFVVELAPDKLKGTLLGLTATVSGLVLLPANILAGILWDAFSPAAPFAFGAITSLLAALILIVFLRKV